MKLITPLSILSTLFVAGYMNASGSGGPWYQSERAIDLDGDMVPDTARIEAIGPSSDSLTITLVIVIDRRTVWAEHWTSAYELVDPPEFTKGAADRDEYLRRGLHAALASVKREPFSLSDYLSMSDAVDSALVRHPPEFQVSFSYGYETAVALYWDPIAAAFRRLWACC